MEPQPGCSKDYFPMECEETPCKMELQCSDHDGSALNILELPDDVLLIILKHCTPHDLKALGFSCPRFARLVCDRSLWCRVDARDRSLDRNQLGWYLERTVSQHTVSLAFRGFAAEARECLGTVDTPRPNPEPSSSKADKEHPEESARPPRQQFPHGTHCMPHPVLPFCMQAHRISNPHLPRFNLSPVWIDFEDDPAADDSPDSVDEYLKKTGGCSGPRWTISREELVSLRYVCPNLTELRLESVNLNCDNTPISSFPPTLTRLSLRASRCYNVEMNKSYLFRIHEHMPLLEYVDLGECSWVEPGMLLPLSKLPALATLFLDRCRRLSECVAYASLAARYGFKQLKVLNLLGTPMGDSEVSGLGWLPELEELYLEPAEEHEALQYHSHYQDDPRPRTAGAEAWEREEPEYFCSQDNGMGKIRSGTPEPGPSSRRDRSQSGSLNQTRPSARDSTANFMRHYFVDPGSVGHCSSGNSEQQRDGGSTEPGPSNPRQVTQTKSPLTRSRSQQELAQAAGPSASTRSKRPLIDEPSTSKVSKRKQTRSDEGPTNKRSRTRETAGNRRVRMNLTFRSIIDHDRQNEEEDVRGPAQDRREEQPARRQQRRGGIVEGAADYYVDGRIQVIYVNVRRPRLPMLRMLVQDEEPRLLDVRDDYQRGGVNILDGLRNGPDFAILPDGGREGNRDMMNILRMPFIQNFLYGPQATAHVSGPSLITDAAINRFGRSDNADVVNYVHIGANGAVRAGAPLGNPSDRPDKSKLKVLVIRGFTGITNRSLNHLVTAAPHLRLLDVTGTKITAQGVDSFKNLRPDCDVKFTVKKED